jgi:hypothetical protein
MSHIASSEGVGVKDGLGSLRYGVKKGGNTQSHGSKGETALHKETDWKR